MPAGKEARKIPGQLMLFVYPVPNRDESTVNEKLVGTEETALLVALPLLLL